MPHFFLFTMATASTAKLLGAALRSDEVPDHSIIGPQLHFLLFRRTRVSYSAVERVHNKMMAFIRRSPIFFLILVCLVASSCNAFGLSKFFSRRKAATMQDLLLSRRTINDFAPELPENWEDALNSAILAATYAPNHKRTEPWRFHLLGPESIRRVCELNAKLVADTKGSAAGEKKLKRWLAIPGWLVVTCKTQVSDDDEKESMDQPMSVTREDYAACCCAVQNLCLSLHARGVGTKWTTGAVNFDPGFAEAVELSSDEYVVGTLWFGAPATRPPPPTKKLSLEDVLIHHK